MKFSAATLVGFVAMATLAVAAPIPEAQVKPACGMRPNTTCAWKREAAPEPVPEPIPEPQVKPACGMRPNTTCAWKKDEVPASE